MERILEAIRMGPRLTAIRIDLRLGAIGMGLSESYQD
jgi:hypothetical protein